LEIDIVDVSVDAVSKIDLSSELGMPSLEVTVLGETTGEPSMELFTEAIEAN
jgi:hypothetical protein